MKVLEFINEIKHELREYDSVGLLDEVSMFRWVIMSLLDFGKNIQELNEVVVNVRRGKAILPDNFDTLFYAGLCDLDGIYDKGVMVADNTYQWIEREERVLGYNSCSPCCIDKEDKLVTERVMWGAKIAEAKYKKPQDLRLGRYIQRMSCADDCNNFRINSPNEITIRDKVLTANFDKGKVYMLYYGTPIDEDGDFIIPNIGHSALIEFLEYHVKSKIFERMLANNDAKNIISLFQYYTQTAREKKDIAYGVVKFLRLTPTSFKKLAKKNKDIIDTYKPKISSRIIR